MILTLFFGPYNVYILNPNIALEALEFYARKSCWKKQNHEKIIQFNKDTFWVLGFRQRTFATSWKTWTTLTRSCIASIRICTTSCNYYTVLRLRFKNWYVDLFIGWRQDGNIQSIWIKILDGSRELYYSGFVSPADVQESKKDRFFGKKI